MSMKISHHIYSHSWKPSQSFFLQDIAYPHSALLTCNFLEQKVVPVMGWISYSPDMNPTDQFFNILGRRVAAENLRAWGELVLILREEWEQILPRKICTFIRSMFARCRECIEANGGYTRYWRFNFHCLYSCTRHPTVTYWSWVHFLLNQFPRNSNHMAKWL